MATKKAPTKKTTTNKKAPAKQPVVTFKDDIIIAGDNGKLYKMSQEDLKPFLVSNVHQNADFVEVLSLLKAGVQVAAIPVPEREGGSRARGDLFCYLLNLSGLKTKTIWEK